MKQRSGRLVLLLMIISLGLFVFAKTSWASRESLVFLPLISNPPNPPPEAVFTIESVTGYQDQYGTLQVIGLVTNNASFAVKGVKVEIEILDSSGALLHVETTNLSLNTLAPGETSPFSSWVTENLPSAASYVAAIRDYDITRIQRGITDIDGVVCVIDDNGDPHATGRLINNTEVPVKIKSLAAATFDQNGDLFTADSPMVLVHYLAPGETGPFRVTMNGPVNGISEIGSCEIYIDAEIEAPIERFDLAFSEEHHTYLDLYESFHLVGMVTNNYSETLTLALISGVYDEDGSVIDAAITDVPTFSIAPGETLPYDFQFWGPLNYKTGTYEDINSYTVQTDPYWTRVISTEYVDIATQNDSYNFSAYQITFYGEVLNNSGSEIDSATVIVNLFDTGTGQLIATGYGGVYDPIAPNETAEYTLWIDTPVGFDMGSVTIEIAAKGELP